MTDFRRPDLDVWEEEPDDEDARPTVVAPRPEPPALPAVRTASEDRITPVAPPRRDATLTGMPAPAHPAPMRAVATRLPPLATASLPISEARRVLYARLKRDALVEATAEATSDLAEEAGAEDATEAGWGDAVEAHELTEAHDVAENVTNAALGATDARAMRNGQARAMDAQAAVRGASQLRDSVTALRDSDITGQRWSEIHELVAARTAGRDDDETEFSAVPSDGFVLPSVVTAEARGVEELPVRPLPRRPGDDTERAFPTQNRLPAAHLPVPMPPAVSSIAPAADRAATIPAPRRAGGAPWWQASVAAALMIGTGVLVARYQATLTPASDPHAGAAGASSTPAMPVATMPAAATPVLVAPAAEAPLVPVAEAPVVPVAAAPAVEANSAVPDEAVNPAAEAPAPAAGGTPRAHAAVLPAADGAGSSAPAPRKLRPAAKLRPSPAAEASAPAATPTPDPSESDSSTDEAVAAPAVALPAQPSREDIVQAMSDVLPGLQACVGDVHGKAELQLTVRPQGFVSYVIVAGDYSGTPEGSCLAQAVRQAKFPPFSERVLRVTYPVQL